MAAKLYVFALLACAYVSSALVPVVKLNDGREMPAIALGTFLGFNRTNKESLLPGLAEPKGNETEQAVVWAIEAGYTHIDTAFIYGIEYQVGRALTKKFSEGVRREDIFVTTKLFNDAHARDAVVPTLRRSLKDLNLDYVDLYLIHFPVAVFLNGTFYYTDYVETWQGMIEAKNLGLAKSIGVSNFNQHQIERLLDHGLEKPAVLQVELNLNIQQPALRAYCKEQQIAVTGYTPFGSLFYGRAAPDAPPPRVDDPVLEQIAKNHNKTVPQIVLRYLIELGAVPLPKSIKKSHIEQNLNVFDFTLTDAERELLRGFDRNYKTILMKVWRDHPDYPFEKNNQ